MNWQETLLIAALRGCALAAVAAATLAALRIRRADAKLAVWTGVMIASLAMPVLPGLLPEFVVERPAAPVAQNVPVQRAVSARAAATIAPLPPEAPGNWKDLASGAYIAVATLLAMRLAAGLFYATRLVRRARAVEELGSDVRESDELNVPATAGILRPVVLLPANWREWEADTLESVLAHERSHATRRDFGVQALARLHRALFWFSPLSWWMTRHIAALAEQASDDSALQAAGTDRARYAEILLAFGSPENRAAAVNLVAMAHWRTLTARVERILDEQFLPGPALSAPRKALAAGAMCVSACLIAAVTVKAQQPVPAPAPSASGQATPKPSPLPEPPESRNNGPSTSEAWVIYGGQNNSMMLGSMEDLDHAHAILRSRINSMWIRRDGKEYVIDDESWVKRAREIQSALAPPPHEEARLEAQAEQLKEQHRALEIQLQRQRVRKPDFERHVKELEAEVQRLKALKLPTEISRDELSQLHERIGGLHARLGELEQTLGGAEHGMEGKHAELEAHSAAIEAMNAKFEAEQARWEKEHDRQAAEAEKRLRSLIDEAIRSGRARRVGDF